MPNRILREGILDSEAVCSLSFQAEVFYRRLMSVVDDFGRFDGRVSVLRSRLYPLQVDKVREADIPRWIAECEKAGLIALYSVSGKQYILFRKLGTPRAKESKFPAPPASIDDNDIQRQQANADETLCTQTNADASMCAQTNADAPYSDSYSSSGTKKEDPPNPPPGGGSDGGKSQPAKKPTPKTKPPPSVEFEAFWQAYPNKVAKAAAAAVFAKIDPSPELLREILAAIAVQKTWPKWVKDGGQYIPHPSTWLNQRRWEDRPPDNLPPPSRPRASTVVYDRVDTAPQVQEKIEPFVLPAPILKKYQQTEDGHATG